MNTALLITIRSMQRRSTVRNFARAVGRRPNPSAKRPVPVEDPDPWKSVKDVASGQTYWWNINTNETTALGAPKPISGGLSGAPPPSGQVAPQPQQQGGIMSGLGGVVAEGFAFGVGSSIARHAVGSFFGGSSSSGSSSDSSSGDDGGDWDI